MKKKRRKEMEITYNNKKKLEIGERRRQRR